MRFRTREQADVDYQVARSNGSWWEHQVRTMVTGGLIAWLEPSSIIDPACGDASLVLAAHRLHSISRATLCDISEPSVTAVIDQARAEGLPASCEVIDAVKRLEIAVANGQHWDVIVLTEFLEHVPDPDLILRLARQVASQLVASSPLIPPPGDDGNPEHLWAFDNEGYNDMLHDAGWEPRVCQNLMLHGGGYNFQIWACK